MSNAVARSLAQIEPAARVDIIGTSQASDFGATNLSFGAMHKLAQLFPARFRNMAVNGAMAVKPGAAGQVAGTGLSEGGWGWVYSQYPNTEKTSGINTTVGAGGWSAGATGSLLVVSSANTGAYVGQAYVVGRGGNAEVLYLAGSADGTHVAFDSATVNAHSAGDPVVAIPDHWAAAKQVGFIDYGINDAAKMGMTTFATAFPHAFRAILSRFFQCAVWEDTSALVRQTSGSWSSVTGVTAGFASGTSYLSTTGATAQLTLDFPPVPAGATLVAGFLTEATGKGALFDLVLDGGSTVQHDTRNINGFDSGSTRAATGMWMPSVYRFKNVTGAAHTVTVTVNTLNTTAYFDFMGVEAPEWPPLLGGLQMRFPSYSLYSGWPYTPADADVTTMNTAINSVCDEFSGVIGRVDKDAVIQKQRKFFSSDGAHLNDWGHTENGVLIAKALNSTAVPLRNLVWQDPVDQRGWYNLTAQGASFGTPFQNSWVNYSTADEPAGWYKDIGTGLVVLRGAIKNTAATTVPLTAIICTLPVGCRPAYTKDFVCASQSGATTVQVRPTGDVILNANGPVGPTSYINLSTISFFAEQ